MAINYVVVDNRIGVPQPVTATSTFATDALPFPLGMSVHAVDQQTGTAGTAAPAGAGVFVYARGSNVASKGQFVHIINNSAVLLAAANSASKFPVGVAAGVLSATNVYGWVQVQGIVDYGRGTNSSIAAGVPLYICAGTAGYLVTNVVAGNQVNGAVLPVSYTSSQSQSLTVQLNFPRVIGLSASI